jgi:hypothetical protein
MEDERSLGSLLHSIGDLRRREDRWPEAEQYYLRASELFRKIDDRRWGGAVDRSLTGNLGVTVRRALTTWDRRGPGGRVSCGDRGWLGRSER